MLKLVGEVMNFIMNKSSYAWKRRNISSYYNKNKPRGAMKNDSNL